MEFEPRDQLIQRQKKLEQIAGLGFDPFPTKFDWQQTIAEIVAKYRERTAEELAAEKINVRLAGRVLTIRLHGKAGFAHIQGQGEKLQIYVKLDAVGDRAFQLFQLLDMGDSIGVEGHLFRTKTNELTVWAEKLTFLSKALLPLPEKWHGLADVELRYRRRYLDLIASEKARAIFVRRAQIIRYVRQFFDNRGYLEVETPMMHPIPGGATARPFITHHNTFDADFYMRIAPELYLKRLVVGGFDRVYEINRNFRNEGVDAIHTPEFTMLEFYEAYSDFRDLMQLTEELFRGAVSAVCGTTKIMYQGTEIDFGHFESLSMRDAIIRHWPELAGSKPSASDFQSRGALRERLQAAHDEIERSRPEGQPWGHERRVLMAALTYILEYSKKTDQSLGEIIGAVFGVIAEKHLIQPTFIYDFPTEISPLSKCKKDDPSVTERFELFINGMELANGFSELNDPAEQERRFQAQVKSGGHDVPKEVDSDYIRALAHGMPPTAGEGVGIDRLVMLLTDSHSIREVILFPTLRPRRDADIDEPAAQAGEA